MQELAREIKTQMKPHSTVAAGYKCHHQLILEINLASDKQPFTSLHITIGKYVYRIYLTIKSLII